MTRKYEKKHRNVRADIGLIDQLKVVCDKKGLKLYWVMNLIIKDYLERNKDKLNESKKNQ